MLSFKEKAELFVNKGFRKELINYEEEGTEINNFDIVRNAVRMAAKAFTSRTLKALKKGAKVNQEAKDIALVNLTNNILEIFSKNINNQEDYDVWHKSVCDEFVEDFNIAIDGEYHKITFGKGQKIVNMAFKFLYCYKDANNYNFFEYCHMPLDSFTLYWFWNDVKSEYNKKSYRGQRIGNVNQLNKTSCGDYWSNLNYNSDIENGGKLGYADIQKLIGNHLKEYGNKYNRMEKGERKLDAEFYIWGAVREIMLKKAFLKLAKGLSEAMSEEEICELLESVFKER